MDDFHVELDACRAARSRGAAAQSAGWYESSWDLMRGLDVREGLPSDATLVEQLALALRQAGEPSAAFTALPSSITAMA